MASYDGWTVVVHNLRKARRKWEQLLRVMRREGGGFLYAGTVLYCGGTGGPSVWVRYVGYVPTHWEDDGQLPTHGAP